MMECSTVAGASDAVSSNNGGTDLGAYASARIYIYIYCQYNCIGQNDNLVLFFHDSLCIRSQ